MKSTDVIQPQALSQPIATDGKKNNIPENATGSELASIAEGFPAVTMESIEDGGLPPRGEDCNGMFYISTDQKVYLQNGGIITFSQEVSDTIGGYPKDAILDYIDSTGNYTKVKSLIDDNTNNFNENPSYIDDINWSNVLTTGSGTSLPLFSVVIQDHELSYQETQGYALQGTYVYSTAKAGEYFGYPTFVKKCMDEYAAATPTTLTVGSTVLNIRQSANGHIYYNISDLATVDTIFNATGEAWFYGVDETNNRIFMPRTKLMISSSSMKVPNSAYVYGSGKGLVYQGANNTPYVQAFLTTDNHRNNHPANPSTISANQNTLKQLTSWSEATDAQMGIGSNAPAVIGMPTKSQATAAGLSNIGLQLDTSGFSATTSTEEKQAFFYYYIVVGNTQQETAWIDIVTDVNGAVADIVQAGDEQIERINAASASFLKTTDVTYDAATQTLKIGVV